MVDERATIKMSATKAASTPLATQARTPPASVSIEPSSAKSAKKARSKSSESEGTLTVTLPADGSAYSDPSFVKDVAESLLLPTDRKRLNNIRPV